MKTLPSHEGHKSYWIDEGQLYESYEIFPNVFHRHILEVKGMEDCEKCGKAILQLITDNYLNK